jgi:hypothetical protein
LHSFLEISSRKKLPNIKALLIYLALISALYAPVVFGGKSLQPALYQPHGVVQGWPYGYEGRRPVNTFNVDLATPAYYEWPVNKLIGDIYKTGSLPLWNPYQAAGTPLAADYSTRAFFPYQILEDLSPVWMWDFFILGRLLVAGFFSYLFLMRVGLSFPAALLGGIFYMFSGTMVWFINLEQMANGAMLLPVLLYSLEVTVRRPARTQIAVSAVVCALVLLAGQPEVALYTLFLGTSYFIFRALSLYKGKRFLSLNIKLAFILAVGLALAAPLIFPFLQFVSSGYHLHRPRVGIGTQGVPNWKRAFAALTPTATEIPADPEILPEVLARFDDGDERPMYFRIFATKGVWDWMGGYTGILSVFLALTGIFIVLAKRSDEWRGVILFFSCFGAAIFLKHFGVRPFVWLGYLPIFDIAWGPRWASPTWVFSFCMAGAIGYQVILSCKNHVYGDIHISEESASGAIHNSREMASAKAPHRSFTGESSVMSSVRMYIQKRLHYLPLIVFLIFLALYLWIPLPGVVVLSLKRNLHFSFLSAPYIIPSMLAGHVETVLVLTAALIMTVHYMRTGKGVYGLIGLAVVELWWAIPRGYNHQWLYLKAIPFVAGLVLVFALYKERWRLAASAAVFFFIAFLWLDLKAPYGFPDRYNPFREPPYVEFLKEKEGHFRVMGGYGVLYPNYSSAVGLQDVRYISALMIPAYQQYRFEHLQVVLDNEEVASSSLWFTGRPERVIALYDDTIGRYFKIVRRGIEEDIRERLPYYSLLGVKYILMPPQIELNETPSLEGKTGMPYLPVIYDNEIKIYENPYALPRSFIAYDFEMVSSRDAQLNLPGYQVRSQHPIVGQRSEGRQHEKEGASIEEYGFNKVVIKASLEHPGLLVLSDVYFDGWEAYVDERPAQILRVNRLLRGVLLQKGKHSVEFRYMPKALKLGAAVGAGGFIVVVVLLIPWRRHYRKHR